MTTAYFYLTPEGKTLAEKLSSSHPGDLYGKDNFKNNLRDSFHRYDYLVCIMAAGIVVRILAPLIVHKTSDPGVVVMDQKGQYAISLLSGHLGGANDLAREMAALSGGDAVITTATDVAGELSFDTFAKAHNMSIENIGQLKHISGALLSGQSVRVVTHYHYPELKKAAADAKMKIFSTDEFTALLKSDRPLPPIPTVIIDEGFTLPDTSAHGSGNSLSTPAFPTNQTSFKADSPASAYPVLYLRPRTICAGIGCKRNMEAAPIKEALLTVLKEEHLSPLSLKCISTIPLKADEPGILTTAENLRVPLTIVPTEDIDALDITGLGISPSDFVAQQTGVLSVSTASSYLASGKGTILRDKVKFKGITIALCQEKLPVQ